MEGVSKTPKRSRAFARAASILLLLFLILPSAPIPSLGQSVLPEPDGSAQQGDAPAAPSGAGTMNSVLPGGSSNPAVPGATDPCNACPPLPASAAPGAAPPATSANPASTAASGSGSPIAPAAGGAEAEVDAAPSVPKAPWFAPPKAPSPADAEDKKVWNLLDQAGIQVLVLGELHLDPEMMKREQNFLLLTYGHGVRTSVIEFPKNEQPRLDRYLNNPTYANMADALLAMWPQAGGLKPRKRAEMVAALAQGLEAVEQSPRQAQKIRAPR